MPRRTPIVRAIVCGVAAGVALFAAAQDRHPRDPSTTSPADESGGIDELIRQLGDERYAVREQATGELILRGSDASPLLRERLRTETDPEVQHRILYILDNVVMPDEALLVIRCDPAAPLRPGDLLTHINGRRVRTLSELERIGTTSPHETVLRIYTPRGPREVSGTDARDLMLSEYRPPNGPALARVIRLYADGFAESAYELLADLGDTVDSREMSKLLRARIAYTAGDAGAAFALLEGETDAVQPAGRGNLWNSPSQLDLSGPGKAPLHLEWVLFTRGGRSLYSSGRSDPDLRMQRILIPARRYADALSAAAGYWWNEFREDANAPDRATAAGNMLAVCSWMLCELDLQSECCRLIGPRSELLRRSSDGVRKWVRVQTDAWLPYFAGDLNAAVDGFYDDAREILARPPRGEDPNLLIRRPEIAARIAFFLYQTAADRRRDDMLSVVNRAANPALGQYIRWMLLGVNERNLSAVRRDLLAVLPNVDDDDALSATSAAAQLEYVQDKPDDDVLLAARQRLAQLAESPQRDNGLMIVDALRQLLAGRADLARSTLSSQAAGATPAALRATVDFLCDPPPSAANHPTLASPLLVVPFGEPDRWLVLSRQRRLLAFDAENGALAPVERPMPNWFPGPHNWPWLGLDASTGRVWAYDVRRIVELGPDRAVRVRLNIATADIAAFDEFASPHFSLVAEAAAATALPAGEERGEFLRSELRANLEFTADPDLPEIAFVSGLPDDQRIVHLALRGGPQLLIDAAGGRAWTSAWFAQRLGLSVTLRFLAQALPATSSSRVIMLTSDAGLLRFDLDAEKLTPINIPDLAPCRLVPEIVPYDRRDPRFYYCAQLPADGGKVFRVNLSDARIDALSLINETLPAGFYAADSRAALRASISARFEQAGVAPLEEFIADAARRTAARPDEPP